MGGGGIQPNRHIISRDNESKVDVLIVIEVDFLYFDDEEISLDGGLVEGDVALDGGEFGGLVGDCDAHGVKGRDEVEVEVFSCELKVFFSEDVTDLELLLFIVHQVGKFLAEFYLKTVDLIQKPDLEGCLFEADNTNDQLSRLLILIPYNDRILLIDGVLMAGSSGHLASLVIVEVGIDDYIHRINHDLSSSLAIHRVFEVNFLLKIHLAFYGIVLDVVVNDVVVDVLVPQVKLKTAV